MKNLGKLKLNKISKNEMVKLKGGETGGVCVTPNCACSCRYDQQPGGSSTLDNCSANHLIGYP